MRKVKPEDFKNGNVLATYCGKAETYYKRGKQYRLRYMEARNLVSTPLSINLDTMQASNSGIETALSNWEVDE